MQDDFIAKGQPKYAKPDAGKAPTLPAPVFGIVKDNVDETRQGAIRVYIADGTDKDSNVKENWVRVWPLGFYGRTVGDAAKTGFGTYKTNPASYGVWHSPPDIGTKVVCVFVNGDPNYGYYLGGVYDPDAMQMVPAIGGVKNILVNQAEGQAYGGAVVLPVTNINDNSAEASAPDKYIDAAKPVHSYVASILNQQGLIRDPIRGVISTSSQREAASRVGWGVSTPGRPIYQGGFDDESIAQELKNSGGSPEQYKVVARRGGHSIVMDDGDIIGRNNLVRIRTSLGHQITMSDDGQTLFIIHSNGQSYIELGKEGTVDIYSTNSFNVRTQGDINFHADNNINIHAEKQLNIRAENIHIQSDGDFKLKVLKDHFQSAGGKLTSLVGGALAMKAGGQASMVAGAENFHVGSKVNLNSGDPATTPEAVEAIKAFAQTDTLFDKQKGFIAAPGKLLSITSRTPAHTPWANAGQGVDVKVELGADESLPSGPSAPLSDVNAAASTAVSQSQSPAVSSGAVQPSVNAASAALNKNSTSGLLGSIAQDASTNPLTAGAVAQGGGIVTAANGIKSAVVGQYASTAQNLQAAGTIKPGSAALVNSLVEKGASLANAMPTTLFTGQQGAQNLTTLTNNITAQANAVKTNITAAQSALTNAGVITGKESVASIAGVVKSGATVGVPPTIDAIKGAAGGLNVAGLAAAAGVGSAIQGGLTNAVGAAKGAASSALKAIGSGNMAGKLADGVTSGLGPIKDSLAGLSSAKGLSSLTDSAKGVAASAFDAIKNSFPTLPAGVPIDAAKIAGEAAKKAEAAAGTIAGAANNLTSGLTNPANALKGAAQNAAAGLQNQLSGGAAALGKALPGAASGNLIKDFQTGAAGILNTNKPSVAGLLNSVTGSVNPNNIVSGVQNAVASALPSSITSAASVLNSVTGIKPSGAVDAFGSVSSIVAGASAGSLSTAINSGVSTLASGLSNLPGGASAAAALKNNALGAAANKLGSATAGLQGLAKGIADKATSALNNLKPPSLDPAAALAKSGLPSGLAASLASQISAIGSGGSVPVGMPVIAINTTNRASITDAVNQLIGDPGIPKPNQLGEISPATTNTVESFEQSRSKELSKLADWAVKNSKLSKKADKAEAAYQKALKKLPQGDPSIQALYDEYKAAATAYSEDLSAYLKAYKEFSAKYG